MAVLLTSTQMKDYLPTLKRGVKISTTLLDDILRRCSSDIFNKLGYRLKDGEEQIVVWTTQQPSLSDIALPFTPESIVALYHTVQRVLIPPDQYRVISRQLVRVPGGMFYPNYFDTNTYAYGGYWIPPVEVHLIPTTEYIDLVRSVLIELVLLELSKLGKTTSHQFDNLSLEQIKDQRQQWFNQGPAQYETARKAILARLTRNGRIG